jgi:LPXTG-motif cell wall-anchored protein
MASSARRLLAVLAVAALATLTVGAAVAGAQEYPPTSSTTGGLVVTPGVNVGGVVAVSGDSCGPNQPVTIAFNGKVVATATTDANGHFATQFTVPSGTAPGTYTVTASNSFCSLSGQTVVRAALLAFTGSSSTTPAIWIGAALVALGAVFVVVARRRRSAGTRV